MARITETEVRKEIESRDERGEIDVDIVVRHHDSEKANDMAHRLYHAVERVLDGRVPPGMLEVGEMDEGELDQFKEAFRDRVGGGE